MPEPDRPAQNARTRLQAAVERHRAGDHAGAAALYRTILADTPDQADALHLLALVEQAEGKATQALERLQKAVDLRPESALFRLNLGRMLRAQGRPAAAGPAFAKAVELAPDNAEACLELARWLRSEGRPGEALALLEAPEPAGKAALLLEAAGLEQALGRNRQALRRYRRAQTAGADAVACLNGAVGCLFQAKRLPAALRLCEALLARRPDDAEALWMRAVLRRLLCAWPADPASEQAILADLIETGRLIPDPFTLLSLSDDPVLIRRATEAWIARNAPPAAEPLAAPAVTRGHRPPRIRVGYLSSEFREHAMGWLTAGLYEAHDRGRFEVRGYSYGPDDGSALARRIRAGLDSCTELRALPHRAAAEAIRRDDLDILVDLKGLTLGARPQILAWRPAPLQVNWLGYAGTMGAPYADYILADRHVIPPGAEGFYSEAVVRLPGSYQVTDPSRAPAEDAGGRAAWGLPEEALVFCCFNQLHKIGPAVFAVWIELLRALPESRLWLLEGHPSAQANLRERLSEAGLDPGRLQFAPKAPQPLHLARHRLADLFLDTLPYGAHTTASDALWAGLPLVTCRGRSFAGRVASGLLEAVGLPELAVETLEDYRDLVLALARDPERRSALRRHLEAARRSAPLFGVTRFARQIEAAYTRMIERQAAGLPPESFDLPA